MSSHTALILSSMERSNHERSTGSVWPGRMTLAVMFPRSLMRQPTTTGVRRGSTRGRAVRRRRDGFLTRSSILERLPQMKSGLSEHGLTCLSRLALAHEDADVEVGVEHHRLGERMANSVAFEPLDFSSDSVFASTSLMAMVLPEALRSDNREAPDRARLSFPREPFGISVRPIPSRASDYAAIRMSRASRSSSFAICPESSHSNSIPTVSVPWLARR